MRQPVQARNNCIMIAIACVIAVTLPIVLPQSTIPTFFICLMVPVAIFTFMACVPLALFHASTARAYKKLRAGDGLITHWMVDAQTWQAFIDFQQQDNQLNPLFENALKILPSPPPEGVQIILGHDAIIIDDDFQKLPSAKEHSRFTTLEIQPGPPMFINMHITTDLIARSGVSHTYYALRFPVMPQDKDEALAALDVYANKHNQADPTPLDEPSP